MMGWVGSGEDFCGLGWVQIFWVGLGFEKVTNDQLCSTVCCEFGPSRLNGVGIGIGVTRKLGSPRYSTDPCHFLRRNNDHLERRDARGPIFCASS